MPLAKKYARCLPIGSLLTYEDIHQEMLLALLKHQSVKSARWAANDMIDKEYVRTRPYADKIERVRRVHLDTIIEAYQLIGRWPWLMELVGEDSVKSFAESIGVSQQSVNERIRRIRRQLRAKA